MSTFDVRKTCGEAIRFAEQAQAAIDQPVSTVFGETVVETVIAGSLRRYPQSHPVPVVGDVDLIVTARDDGVVQSMTDLALPPWLTVTDKKAHGWLDETRVRRGHDEVLSGRMMVDAWWCPWPSIGPFAMFLTGPPEMNIWLRQRANAVGLMVTQYGLFTQVAAPTKTYPKRVKPGDRLDPAAEPDLTVLAAEQQFWAAFTDRCGLSHLPFPMPYEREEVMRRAARY